MLPRSTRPLLAAVTLLGACAGSGVGLDREGRPLVQDAGAVDDAGVAAGYGGIQSGIFGAICAVECHVGAGAPQSLQLDKDNAYRLLVNVDSSEVPAMKRVKPGAPDDSYLVAKLVAMDARRTGERMPRNGPPYLSASQIEAVRQWILAGATK